MHSASRWSTYGFIVLLAIVAAALGWNYWKRPVERRILQQLQQAAKQVSPSPTSQTTPEVPLAVQVAAVLAWPVDADASWSAQIAAVQQAQPRFVTLFGTAVSQSSASALVAELDRVAQQPWVWVDHEGGSVQRLSGPGFTRLPSWSEACQQSASVSASVWQTSAAELKQVGVDGVLSPVVDLKASGSALGRRVCAGSTQQLTAAVTAWITTWRKAKIEPVIKHFPGIGAATKDQHRFFDRVDVNPEQVKVYADVLNAFPSVAVMTAHVGITNQFPDVPCSLSSACVQELATNYPQVLIISDALDMAAAGFSGDGQALKPLTQRAVEALKAGNHVLLFGPDVSSQEMIDLKAALVTQAEADPFLKTQITKSYQRIIKYQGSH